MSSIFWFHKMCAAVNISRVNLIASIRPGCRLYVFIPQTCACRDREILHNTRNVLNLEPSVIASNFVSVFFILIRNAIVLTCCVCVNQIKFKDWAGSYSSMVKLLLTHMTFTCRRKWEQSSIICFAHVACTLTYSLKHLSALFPTHVFKPLFLFFLF